jgi:hypothetical protein
LHKVARALLSVAARALVADIAAVVRWCLPEGDLPHRLEGDCSDRIDAARLHTTICDSPDG